MLEYCSKKNGPLVDFRRGLLGVISTASPLISKPKAMLATRAANCWPKCCQFNGFSAGATVQRCDQLCAAHVEALPPGLTTLMCLTQCMAIPHTNGAACDPVPFDYLIQIKVLARPARADHQTLRLGSCCLTSIIFGWIAGFSELTIRRCGVQVGVLLEADGAKQSAQAFPCSQGRKGRKHRQELLRTSTDRGLSRKFGRDSFATALPGGTPAQTFPGWLPPIRRYRHASLPKGLDDSVLGKCSERSEGHAGWARDYAIVVLMMAYGIRGVSAPKLL